MKIIIHAGCYKTATSSIQLLCNRYRDLLLEKAGILYPRTGLRLNVGSKYPDSKSHHSFVHPISNQPPASAERDAVIASLADGLRKEAEESGCSTILISSELLSNKEKEVKQAFVDKYCAFADSVKVHYAARAADEYVESINNQTIKGGKRLHRAFHLPPYEKDISDWREIVGPENVDVLYFSAKKGGDFISRYLLRLGIDVKAASIDTNVQDNPAATVKGCLLRRAYFRFAQERDLINSHGSRVRFAAALAKIEAAMEPSPKLLTLSVAERHQILQQSEAQMRRISEWMSEEDAKTLIDELNPKRLEGVPEKNIDDAVSLSPLELYSIISATADRFADESPAQPKARRARNRRRGNRAGAPPQGQKSEA